MKLLNRWRDKAMTNEWNAYRCAIGSWYAPFETVSVLAAFFQRFSQRFQGIRGKIGA